MYLRNVIDSFQQAAATSRSSNGPSLIDSLTRHQSRSSGSNGGHGSAGQHSHSGEHHHHHHTGHGGNNGARPGRHSNSGERQANPSSHSHSGGHGHYHSNQLNSFLENFFRIEQLTHLTHALSSAEAALNGNNSGSTGHHNSRTERSASRNSGGTVSPRRGLRMSSSPVFHEVQLNIDAPSFNATNQRSSAGARSSSGTPSSSYPASS